MSVTKERRLEIIIDKLIKGHITIEDGVNKAIKYNIVKHLLSSIIVTRWIEDFIDEDTKEVVSIVRFNVERKE